MVGWFRFHYDHYNLAGNWQGQYTTFKGTRYNNANVVVVVYQCFISNNVMVIGDIEALL